MASPNPKRQKTARNTLNLIFDSPDNCSVIHYSCESFNDRPDGQSPRVTSIAVLDLASEQVTSFSIHLVAERKGVPFHNIQNNYDSLERTMLAEFFGHLKSYQDRRYLHWNMRDVGYGFKAIEHRFLKLGGCQDGLYIIENSKKLDLARILKDIYGDDYVGHPRMENLLAKNSKTPRAFLTGSEEASAFDNCEYFKLHQSTLGKVHAFADIARLAHEDNLKTNATWWEMHGGGLRETSSWLSEHPKFTASCGLASIASLIVGIVAWLG